MKILEKMIKEELLQTRDDVCVSIYIPHGEPSQMCSDLKEMIVESSSYLQKVFTVSETNQFLAPLVSLSKDEVSKIGGGLSIFRSQNTFRIIGIHSEIEKECYVSNHFNVKPLLGSLQEDRSFMCVDFSESNVDILQGDSESFRSVGCFGLAPSDYREIDSCIERYSVDGKDSIVFASGNSKLAKEFIEHSRLANKVESVVDKSAYGGDYTRLWETLNDRMRFRTLNKIKKSILDFNIALMSGAGKSDLEDIISAAKSGNIKKLIVSKDQKVWGRIDAYKNHINRINKQVNYEDDDLLDSISEKVLESGGEVVVARTSQMPPGKNCLAILKEAG